MFVALMNVSLHRHNEADGNFKDELPHTSPILREENVLVFAVKVRTVAPVAVGCSVQRIDEIAQYLCAGSLVPAREIRTLHIPIPDYGPNDGLQ